MNISVIGLWHLGSVTAACLATAGYNVTGLEFDEAAIRKLNDGHAPLFEPGLDELIQQALGSGRLRFTADTASALQDADLVWITCDTPVDEDDHADVEYVCERVKSLFPFVKEGSLILISSQVPVGTTRRLEDLYRSACPQKIVSFGYSPENLRLGKAVAVFRQPERVVVGLREAGDRPRITTMLEPFTKRIEWMSVESAEMTKHALNAFLATSIVFTNEIATLCEAVGADAKEVERGLKTDARIGPKAYLAPGVAFSGGTLARDVGFLSELGTVRHQSLPLLAAVMKSNQEHEGWIRNKLLALRADWRGQRVAIWGLTYKPGTDTLRRSSAVALCEWLAGQGAVVCAHDPAVKTLPEGLANRIILCATPLEACRFTVALVAATAWPDYQAVTADAVVGVMQTAVVIDPNRFLVNTLGADKRICYITVGKAVNS